MTNTIRFFSIVLLALALFSCAVQQHTENSVSIYQQAMRKYEKKDYYEAKKLFQEAIPLLKGKKEIISAQFYLAHCYFHEKKYSDSAYYFSEFAKTYPKVQQTEEALYMQGYAMYLDSPDIRLDTTKTEKALNVLQQYKHQYPTGNYQSQVQQYIHQLQDKLGLKEFRIAKLYYNLGHYRAALITIHNFQEAYPATLYSEEAIYIKTKAQLKISETATGEEQLSSWKLFIEYYYELLDQYPNSKYTREMQAKYELALEKVDQLTTYKSIKNN